MKKSGTRELGNGWTYLIAQLQLSSFYFTNFNYLVGNKISEQNDGIFATSPFSSVVEVFWEIYPKEWTERNIFYINASMK